MSLLGALLPKGPTGFGHNSTAEEVSAGLDLTGKHVLVTGVNTGLGKETARVLALRGARVLGTGRTVEKARAGLDPRGVPLACELAEPASVRACVAEIRGWLEREGARLDAIVANAGVMALPRLQTAHGVELQLFTNHFGHFLLVTGLVDTLAEDGRVVVLSSSAHRLAPRAGIDFDNLDGARGYDPWRAYGQSKFANLLFARSLARRFAGSRRVAVAVHPGGIATDLGRHLHPLVAASWKLATPLAFKTVAQGAATSVFAAAHPAAAHLNGEYLADCNVARARRDAADVELGERLWRVTEERLRATSGG